MDIFRSTVSTVLEFLFTLMSDGLGYSGLNTARSMLSTMIELDIGTPVGKHPLVMRFLKGVFLSTPVQSTRGEIYDVKCILDMLRKLSPVRRLTLQQLSVKLVMLLALVTAQRGQTLWFLDIDHMDISESCQKVTFHLKEHVKQSRPLHRFNQVSVKAYPPDRRLCVGPVYWKDRAPQGK